MRCDIQVLAIESKLVVRRNENLTPIVKPAIPLPTVATVTLQEISSQKILVEQAQGEDVCNYLLGDSAEEIRAEGTIGLLEEMLEADMEIDESQSR